MKILFLTILDFSSLDERGIYTDLLREFVKNGHDISVISPSEKRKKKKTEMIEGNSYQILKLKIGNIQKTSIIEKGISTLLIESQYKRGIKKYFSSIKFDLVLFSTPPITLLSAVKYIKVRDNAKVYLLLKDIFPQNAVDLGIIKKKGLGGLLYKYFRNKEQQLYKTADFIGCMSQANVDYILKHNTYLNKGIVEVCPNSIEPVVCYKNADSIRRTREKYEIPLDKTVFIYGGNIGKPQGIDFLIKCMWANKYNEDVFILIVGSGSETYKIENFLKISNSNNVKLYSQLPKKDFDILVNSCDVGLIFLDNRFTIPNFPSRVLSYMQASVPVLAVTDVNTDIGDIIESGNFGLWIESNYIERFNNGLQKLCCKENRIDMGKNARKYLVENYTAGQSFNIIMKHFSKKR